MDCILRYHKTSKSAISNLIEPPTPDNWDLQLHSIKRYLEEKAKYLNIEAHLALFERYNELGKLNWRKITKIYDSIQNKTKNDNIQ